MTKTILQITPSLETTGGGVERGTLDVAKEIAEVGYKSVILTSGGEMAEKYKHKGVLNFYLSVEKKGLINYFRLKNKFQKLLKIIKPDIVHVRSRWPAFCLNSIIKTEKIPLITTYHGTYSGNTNFLKKRYNSVMVEGDKIIAISEFIRKHILKYFPSVSKNLVLINRGIDTDYFNSKGVSLIRKENIIKGLNISEDHHIILLPGRLTSWKGQEIAIDAAKYIKNLAPDLRFVFLLVGSQQNRESYLNRLKEKISKNNLEHHVAFLGNKLDMPAVYSISDVVLSTSTLPEAFGRVSAEASAMGKPIIATNHGGSQDIIRENITGWFVRPKNPTELSNKILEIIRKRQSEKDKIGQNARERIIRYFNLKLMLKKTIQLYEELLSKKNTYN